MGEKLNFSNNAENQEQENISDYDLAVKETMEDYADKTPFEQKVMRDIVIGERYTKETISGRKDPWGNILTKDEIKKSFEDDLNECMNCGGFALEIFGCLFSGSKNIEDATRHILETFPFVRLDDGRELGEDEYRVLYRHAEGGVGHHFVKEVDGRLLEKNARNPIQEFEKWDESLEDAPEVTFVVNRDHDIWPKDEEGRAKYTYMI